jgi:hypothetical protein
VGTSDVENIELPIIPPATLRGQIQYDDDTGPHPNTSQITLTSMGLEHEGFGATSGTNFCSCIPRPETKFSTSSSWATAAEMTPFQLRNSIADLLLHSRGGSSILLLIEDLHWADPSTMDVLDSLVARQANLPAFLVCTIRSGAAVNWSNVPLKYRLMALSSSKRFSLIDIVWRFRGCGLL